MLSILTGCHHLGFLSNRRVVYLHDCPPLDATATTWSVNRRPRVSQRNYFPCYMKAIDAAHRLQKRTLPSATPGEIADTSRLHVPVLNPCRMCSARRCRSPTRRRRTRSRTPSRTRSRTSRRRLPLGSRARRSQRRSAGPPSRATTTRRSATPSTSQSATSLPPAVFHWHFPLASGSASSQGHLQQRMPDMGR